MSGQASSGLRGLFDWWRGTLVDSLPASLRDPWQRFRHRCDFVILHHEQELLVRNRRGEVVAQVDLVAEPRAGETEMELDFVVGDAVVALPSRRSDEETEAVGAYPAREDNTARVINLPLNREEITQLIDETGRIDEQVLENTQLFFFRDGDVHRLPADSSHAAPAADTEIDFDLSANEGSSSTKRLRRHELIARFLGKGRCRYLLPPEQLLSLRLSYPLQVKDNIDTVLRYDLEKHMPLGLEEIRYFHRHRIDRDAGTVHVDVEILKREDHARLLEELGDLLDRGLELSTAGFHREYRQSLDLRPDGVAGKGRHPVVRRAVWLALAATLLAAILMLPYWMLHQAGDGGKPVTAERLARAGEIQALKRTLQRRTRIHEAVAAEISGHPRVTELLRLLSEQLGEQAWLTGFQLEGRDLRIKGEAVAASLVSDDLNRSGRFEDIRFVSSIIKNAASGKEAFEISMKVTDDE